MNYTIKRGEQTWGPYTLAEVQQYVASGNIAQDDLAQSEGMTDWAPVSQVVGNVAVPVALSGAAVAPVQEVLTVPLPPNLHWAILLVLELVTRNFFSFIWAFVQANWARKLDPNSKALILVAMYPAGILAGIAAIAFGVGYGSSVAPLGVLFIVAGTIAYIVGMFSIRAAMESYYNSTENIGLALSGVMTFFFGTIYLQYKINEIAKGKKAALSIA